MSISWPFNPASPQASDTLHLFILVLILMAGVFVIVTGVVVYAVFRFRSQPGQGDPPQDTGQQRWEFVWIGAAAALLLVVFIPTVIIMGRVDPPVGRRSPDVVVVGHQWWWEIRYPHAGIVTANEVHLPVGTQVLLHLASADVIHDFWVPQLARKMDMTPGHPGDISLQADRPGEYVGACVEYCGAEHAWMRILVIADPPAAFEAWQRRQRRPAPPPATADAIAGAGLFQRYVCQACHAPGVAVGPDLGHLASRRTLAAGVLPNTPANLVRWLRDPQAVKPGSLMPNFHLTDADARRLVAYLETLQ